MKGLKCNISRYLPICVVLITIKGILCGKGYPWPSDHTMLKYPGPLPECKAKQVMAGLSLDVQNFIVDLHNELREKHEKNKFGVFHSGLLKLVWNDELATVAQRWADQCMFGNDANRDMLDGSSVGQFVYLGYRGRNSAEVDIKLIGPSDDVLVNALDHTIKSKVMMNMGNVHSKVTAAGGAWNLLKPLTYGTVGVLNEENSDYDQVKSLLGGMNGKLVLDPKIETILGKPIVDVEFSKTNMVIEMMPHVPCVISTDAEDLVVDVASDGDCTVVASAEHVPCVTEREGRDMVIEVGISGDCGEIFFDFGTIDLNFNLNDNAHDLFFDLGLSKNPKNVGLLNKKNSKIEEIESLLAGSEIDMSFGRSLQKLLGHPRTVAEFDIGRLSVEKPVVDLSSPLKTAVSAWFKTAIKGWFTDIVPPGGKDYILYDSNRYTMSDGLEVSQLLYSGTSDIGCGVSVYKEQNFPGWDYVLLVCNYRSSPTS